MIQNELRKGNIVNRIDEFGGTHTGTITQIKATVAEYITPERSYDSAYFKYISGIPLTPELITKCGAAWDGEYCYNLTSPNDKILISWGENGLWVDHMELPHIKSMHQLQNLYFSLTGQELEVKL